MNDWYRRFSCTNVELKNERDEIDQAKAKSLNTAQYSEELEMSSLRTCADVSVLRFKKDEWEEDKIVVEEGASL